MSFFKKITILFIVVLISISSMLADFGVLVIKQTWTPFDQARATVYVWGISTGISMLPPVGPLKAARHAGSIMRSSVDGIYPSYNTMSYMRSLITSSDDCKRKIKAFEKTTAGKSFASGSIKCDVSFGLGMGDTFNVQLLTHEGMWGTKTSFFVDGLGFIPCAKGQSPVYLVRNSNHIIKSIFSPLLLAGDGLMVKLIRYDLIEPVWINLTSSPSTSYFSNNANRLSRSRWIKITK